MTGRQAGQKQTDPNQTKPKQIASELNENLKKFELDPAFSAQTDRDTYLDIAESIHFKPT